MSPLKRSLNLKPSHDTNFVNLSCTDTFSALCKGSSVCFPLLTFPEDHMPALPA